MEESENWVYRLVIVNHIDGNKLNNHVDNLEWCSYSENLKHAISLGLANRRPPQDHNESLMKLTEEDVKYIKSVYSPRHREFGARALGRKFGVNKNTVLDILKGIAYKDFQ